MLRISPGSSDAHHGSRSFSRRRSAPTDYCGRPSRSTPSSVWAPRPSWSRPLGAAYLLFEEATGHGGFGNAGFLVRGLLLTAGPLTAIPLALFAFGARRVSYATVGIVQYIGPTMQLLIGIRVFHESFTLARAAGFACIWAALLLYVGDSVSRAARRGARRAT